MKHYILTRPTMMKEAQKNGKGFHFAIEALIFIVVFLAAQILQIIPVTVGTLIGLFSSPKITAALSAAMETGNIAEYSAAIEDFLTHTPNWMMILQLFATAITTLVAILYCKWFEKRSVGTMGLRRKDFFREYGIGTLIGIVLISLCVGICCLTNSLKIHTSSFAFGTWLLYLIGFLIQGMSEEVLCRGYMLVSVSRKNALWLAVLTNSLLFGLLHIANPGFGILPLLNIVLFGVFESIYVIKRGDLWGACAIHSFWNFFQGNVFGVSVSGLGIGASPLIATPTANQTLLNGGSFGLEGGIVVTVVMAIATAILLFLIPAKKETETVA